MKLELTKDDLYQLCTASIDYGRILNPSKRVKEICKKLEVDVKSVENGFGGYDYIELKELKDK